MQSNLSIGEIEVLHRRFGKFHDSVIKIINVGTPYQTKSKYYDVEIYLESIEKESKLWYDVKLSLGKCETVYTDFVSSNWPFVILELFFYFKDGKYIICDSEYDYLDREYRDDKGIALFFCCQEVKFDISAA